MLVINEKAKTAMNGWLFSFVVVPQPFLMNLHAKCDIPIRFKAFFCSKNYMSLREAWNDSNNKIIIKINEMKWNSKTVSYNILRPNTILFLRVACNCNECKSTDNAIIVVMKCFNGFYFFEALLCIPCGAGKNLQTRTGIKMNSYQTNRKSAA